MMRKWWPMTWGLKFWSFMYAHVALPVSHIIFQISKLIKMKSTWLGCTNWEKDLNQYTTSLRKRQLHDQHLCFWSSQLTSWEHSRRSAAARLSSVYSPRYYMLIRTESLYHLNCDKTSELINVIHVTVVASVARIRATSFYEETKLH